MDNHANRRRAEADANAARDRRHAKIDHERELATEQPPPPAAVVPTWMQADAAAAAEADRIRWTRRRKQQQRGLNLTEIAYAELVPDARPVRTAEQRARIRSAALLEAENPRWDAAMQAEFRRIAATI